MHPNPSVNALVTGASRKVGIGAAIARELARRGAHVFLAYYHSYDRESGLAGDRTPHSCPVNGGRRVCAGRGEHSGQ